MTDLKPTTSEEIARLRKWKRAPSNMPEGWIDPNGIELGWVETLPDFEHEWNHAGPLLEEMERDTDWLVAGHLVRNARKEGDTLTEAISRAWLAWKKEGA